MPKQRAFPCVVSGAVTKQVFDLIQQEAETLGCSVSDVIRRSLYEHFEIPIRTMFYVTASDEELKELCELGFDLEPTRG